MSIPNFSPTAVNTARNAIPSMISGTMIGNSDSVSIAPCPRNFRPAMPIAPSVPITIAMPQLHAARIRLVHSESSSPRVSRNSAS